MLLLNPVPFISFAFANLAMEVRSMTTRVALPLQHRTQWYAGTISDDYTQTLLCYARGTLRTKRMHREYCFVLGRLSPKSQVSRQDCMHCATRSHFGLSPELARVDLKDLLLSRSLLDLKHSSNCF